MSNNLKIINRYKRHEMVGDIAKEFGISKVRVYQIINHYKDSRAKDRQEVEDSARERLTNDGWFVLKNGYPDFFCYHPEKKEFKFVEVKGASGSLRKNQSVMINYLEKAGFNVEVMRILTNDITNKKFSEMGKKSWESKIKKAQEKSKVAK